MPPSSFWASRSPTCRISGPPIRRSSARRASCRRATSTRTSIGYGASVPFFWAIAPNYDLTITPTFLSRQGVLGQVEWRHRLENGTYNIRAAGISQQEPEAFLASPYGAGDRDFRGSLETTGLFYINQNWRWGWDIALLSDKWFLSNYKIRSESLSSYLRQGIDLDPLPPGPGRSLLLRRAGLLFPDPVQQRLAEAAADRRSGPRLQQALHALRPSAANSPST